MPTSWWSIRVELVAGGHEEPLWPRPGRVLIAHPDTTFQTFAQAIHAAFGRWKADEQHHFVLADGTRLTTHDASEQPDVTGADTDSSSAEGASLRGTDTLDDASTALSMLAPGDHFLYESDAEQHWQHVCTVSKLLVDPQTQFDIDPDRPTVTASWGSVPDPYGRVWDEYQFDHGAQPEAPDPPLSDLPPLDPSWQVSLRTRQPGADFPFLIREAEETHPGALLGLWHSEAIKGLDDVLESQDDVSLYVLLRAFDPLVVAHRCAVGLQRCARGALPEMRELLIEIIEDLETRGWDGDVQLARVVRDELEGAAIGVEPRRVVEVDLDLLVAILSSPVQSDRSWTLDVSTSQLLAPGKYPRGWLHRGDIRPDRADNPDHIGIIGFGPDYVQEDIRIVAEYQGFSLEEDVASESSLLIEERSLGRARAWLDEVGLRPV